MAYSNGRPVRLVDVADVQDSVADIRNAALINGKQGIPVILFRQPGANVIKTVDAVLNLLPQLRAAISPAINLSVVMDRSPTIRASMKEAQRTVVISGYTGDFSGIPFFTQCPVYHYSEYCGPGVDHQHFRGDVPFAF